jgi:16S rRNA pseudouridine516 synthase
MQSKRTRLDRFLSAHLRINRREIKPLLAQGRILLDGIVATEVHAFVDEFTQVILDGQVLQAKQVVYLMLHKPMGIVCATKDKQHKTVIDLLDHPQRGDLHIVGRLDFNSTGLVLLTNDGRWSRQLTQPETKVVKHYRVTLAEPLDETYVRAFAVGMEFEFEGITTRPARLDIIDSHTADVFLTEGRYHQIKRMFGRFQNEVLTLHRCAVGNIQLDAALAPGESRALSDTEIKQSDTLC